MHAQGVAKRAFFRQSRDPKTACVSQYDVTYLPKQGFLECGQHQISLKPFSRWRSSPTHEVSLSEISDLIQAGRTSFAD